MKMAARLPISQKERAKTAKAAAQGQEAEGSKAKALREIVRVSAPQCACIVS